MVKGRCQIVRKKNRTTQFFSIFILTSDPEARKSEIFVLEKQIFRHQDERFNIFRFWVILSIEILKNREENHSHDFKYF